MQKPILFHDIDGVLYGDYDEHYQLRPGVKTWLDWAHRNFDVVWLTTWEPIQVKTLLFVLYHEKLDKNLSVTPPIRTVDWKGYAEKELWLAEMVTTKLAGREWFWVDDYIPPVSILTTLHLDPARCLRVPYHGAHELKALREVLETFLNESPSQIDPKNPSL